MNYVDKEVKAILKAVRYSVNNDECNFSLIVNGKTLCDNCMFAGTDAEGRFIVYGGIVNFFHMTSELLSHGTVALQIANETETIAKVTDAESLRRLSYNGTDDGEVEILIWLRDNVEV